MKTEPPFLEPAATSTCPLLQVYYKLPYVDKVITNPEQRICEDVPKFTKGLAELVGEWVNAVIDAAFYSWQLKQYSQTNTYTLAILGYVIGAGGITSVLAPNFGRLFKRQQENEGARGFSPCLAPDCLPEPACLGDVSTVSSSGRLLSQAGRH